MAESILKPIFIKTFLFCLLLFGVTAQGGYGQTLEPGDIVITEFMADPDATNDSEGEYIELYNRRAVPININGFTLSDDGSNSHQIDNGGVLEIPAESFITLAKSGSPGFRPDYAYSSDGSFTLGNSGDEIVLTDTNGKVIARLNHSDSSKGTSLELNDVENVDASGQTNPSDYVESEASFGNADNGSPGSSGKTSTAESPKVRFVTTESTASENSGSGAVKVLLQHPDGNEVTVDVILQASGSGADGEDFVEASPVTLTFPASASNGAKKIAYTPGNDGNFENTEKAVFTLSNLKTSGAATITSPSTHTLEIIDDDPPQIYVNEIHADPASGLDGDADGNGTRDENDDEFIEIVNNQDTDVDISNWEFYNKSDLKHIFSPGTVIPANSALVLFADDKVNPEGNFGGALIQSTNKSATLGLVDAGGTISLQDADGNVILSVDYSDANNDQSIVRTGDVSDGAFIDHSAAAGADGSLFSPGTKVDGTPFGSKQATAFRGSEGWRMVSLPVQSVTFEKFFADFWIQGVKGSDNLNGAGTLFSWKEKEGGTFEVPSNMSNDLRPGQGYIVYAFEDDEYNTPGVQGGFPKTIQLDGKENSTVTNISVSATDDDDSGAIDAEEGWNLLGNPFGTDISASAVIAELETVVTDNANLNAHLYIWDHDGNRGNGEWVELSGSETIAPFQAFFVRYTTTLSENISFTKSALEANQGTGFYKSSDEEALAFELNLHGDKYFDTYTVEFSDKGTTELDRYDAFKLFSLNSNSINLFSTLSNNRLQKNVLPKELESSLEIPLSFDASGRSELIFKWDNKFKNIPNDWEFSLIDQEQNREINLRRSKEYRFTVADVQTQESANTAPKQKSLLNKAANKQYDSRFVLTVKPASQGIANNDLPESAKLNPNYPNPFNPQTTIPYELTEDAEVKLTVWNMIGQKVATLVDGLVEAGSHQETWNAASMPSGIYIARFEVGSKVFTRKMTLIK